MQERERIAALNASREAQEAAMKAEEAVRAREEAERQTRIQKIQDMFGMEISLENISVIVRVPQTEIERTYREYRETGTFRY